MANYLSYKFNTLREADLAAFANNVIERMTADAQFSHLKPSVDDLKAKYDAYNVAASNAASGDKIYRLDKKECFDAMKKQLDYIAQNVDVMSIDKPSVALAAGFDIHQPTTPITDLKPPTALALQSTGNSGSIKLSWKKAPGAISYGIEHLVKGETVWKNGTYSFGQTAVIPNLEAGTYVTFRLRSISHGGKISGWSTEISSWIQ